MFVVETVGRRGAFIGGSIVMGIQFLVIALIVKYNPPPANATGKISSLGATAIAMIYLEAAMDNLPWGLVAWPAPQIKSFSLLEADTPRLHR